MKYIFIQACLCYLLLLIAGTTHYSLAQTKKEVQKFSREVEAQGVKSVKIELKQAAGTLTVSGGAAKLMEGQFAFTKDAWKPDITFNRAEEKLLIIQPGNNRNLNMEEGDRNDWIVKLNNQLPSSMELSVGAGQSNINLQGMKLKSLLLNAGAGDFTINLANTSLPELEVQAGVGKMELDLTGKWNNNLQAEINGGIGDITIKLPRKTGVRVKVSGLGSIEADGFKKEGGYYINQAYTPGNTHLTLDISGGLGSVNLQMQ